MTVDLAHLLRWWAVAAAALVAARLGAAPAAFQGLAIGLLVGSSYVWLLLRRTRAVSRMSVKRAIAATQVGAAARLAFVLLAFGVAARLWPGAGLGWGMASFAVPLVTRMVVLARGVGG